MHERRWKLVYYPPETASTTDSTSPRQTSTATALELTESHLEGPRNFVEATTAIDDAKDRIISISDGK